jgi:hypothetical protein
MTSACLNPVLYGFLNESYKKEFKAMWVQVRGSQHAEILRYSATQILIYSET